MTPNEISHYKSLQKQDTENRKLIKKLQLDKQKLKNAFEETIWMAIRYADGRNTCAPSTVRYAVKDFQIVFPDWKPRPDGMIKPPKEEEDVKGLNFASDHLHDIF